MERRQAAVLGLGGRRGHEAHEARVWARVGCLYPLGRGCANVAFLPYACEGSFFVGRLTLSRPTDEHTGLAKLCFLLWGHMNALNAGFRPSLMVLLVCYGSAHIRGG